MFTNRPAMKFCVPFILGIIIGWQSSLGVLNLCIGLALFFVLLSVARRQKSMITLRQSILYIVILLFGMVKITYDAKFLPNDNVSNFVSPGKKVILHGTISDLPSMTQRSLRFGVEAESVDIDGKKCTVSGDVLVTVPRGEVDSIVVSAMSYGRAVCLAGELGQAGTARNPGEFDLGRYLHLNNVYARFYADEVDSSVLGREVENNFLGSFVFPVRCSIGDCLDSFVGGDEAKFLKGLVIGERTEIPLEVKSAFINSGVMHILAVSGLHVAIVAMILMVLFHLMRIPEKGCLIATSLCLIYYTFLTGAAASITRSSLMAIVFLGAKYFEHRSDIYNTLAVSAIIILLIDAKQLFQAGFQLSFVAVFSLVYLYPKMYGLKNFLPVHIRNHRFVTSLVAVIAVSVAAGIGTLPFTSIYFGKISLIGFLANVIVVPLSNIILILGMVTVAFSFLSSWVASIYAQATSFLTWILLHTVDFFGYLPFAYVDSHFTIWSSLFYYGVVAVLINIGKVQVRKRLIIASLIVLNIFLYRWIFFADLNDSLRVTFLDVGQGDAIFLEFPNGKNFLIDGGPRTFASDAGARFVTPFLKHKGVDRINTILISHPHSDHLGGVPYLLRHFEVDEVIDAGSSVQSSLFQEYFHLIDSLNISRRTVKAGTMIEGFSDVRLYLLHPSVQFVSADSYHRFNLNNQSIVLKMLYGENALLFAGDAERESEEQIIKIYDRFLQSGILKIAHHGSITSSSRDFLKHVQPAIAVVSVGAKNKFGQPSPIVLKKLTEIGCKYYRTDQSGAVMLESDGKRWSMVDWR